MMRLQDRTALVTGSSSGIGRAIATRFAHEGADLAINGRDEEKIARVVKEIEALGRRALGIRANVGSFAESKAMVERAVVEFGHLDILVCAAGLFDHVSPPELTTGIVDSNAAPFHTLRSSSSCANRISTRESLHKCFGSGINR
jgi:NAD(P)-dependent dehydrogenase (short-subunit alcohol dehydrogenase family)